MRFNVHWILWSSHYYYIFGCVHFLNYCNQSFNEPIWKQFFQLCSFPLDRSVMVKITTRDGLFTSNTYVFVQFLWGAFHQSERINNAFFSYHSLLENSLVSVYASYLSTEMMCLKMEARASYRKLVLLWTFWDRSVSAYTWAHELCYVKLLLLRKQKKQEL